MKDFLSKVFYILPAHRGRLLYTGGLFLFVSFLECFGIGIIGPFMALASNPELIDKTDWLSRLYDFSGLASKPLFVALMGALTVLVFLVRSVFSWWTQVYIFIFGYQQKSALTTKLMSAYLSAPYTFHLSKNSSQIIQNVVMETSKFANGVLIPLMISISNLFVAIFITFLLGITSLSSLLVLVVIALPLAVFFNIFKDKVSNWGKEASLSEKSLIRLVNHSLGGIKETKVIGCEDYFEDGVQRESERYAKTLGNFFAYKHAPRSMIEALLILFLIGFTSVFLIINGNIQSLTATLSVFAISSVRLIPAANNVVSGLTSLKNSTFVVNKLCEDLKEIERGIGDMRHGLPLEPSQALPFERSVRLQDIAYRYPSAAENALNSISLEIKKGQSIALIGQSGAGKTTLVDVILGLLRPQQGDIIVDDEVSVYSNLRQWQDLVGYIPQSIFLTDDTIERNIAFGIPDHLIDLERIHQSLKAAQLADFVAELPDGLKTMVGERGVLLSGGQRQRIGIARALYHGREILVLDEATAALDNETERLVTEAIQQLSGKLTMVIIAHRLTTVKDCDCIYVLEKGKIVRSGTYNAVVLGEEAQV